MEAKNLIGGLLAGAAIGVAVGILLAPESGEQTRMKIIKRSKNAANDFKATLVESVESLKSQYNRGVDELSQRGKDLISQANERVKA